MGPAGPHHLQVRTVLLQHRTWPVATWPDLEREHDIWILHFSRFDQNSGDIEADSAIEDFFDEYSNDENELSYDAFETCLKDCGFTRGEIHHFFKE